MRIVEEDIACIEADILVNAANGIGYMGGRRGIARKLKGVAEALHYATKGRVEKEAKVNCKKVKWLPRLFCGHRVGEVYLTSAGGLKAGHVIHAVTMYLPGSKAYLGDIPRLLREILSLSRKLGARSVAIPLLGTGTGGLSKNSVMSIYTEMFSHIDDMEIIVVGYDRSIK
jgi:O-acetyl-ADP-ribose deacetylase (regulator of RNase III)